MSSSKKKSTSPETVITLTLAAGTSLTQTGTLVVRRGALAIIKRIQFNDTFGLASAIRQAATELNALERNPPIIPALTDTAATTTTTGPEGHEGDDAPAEEAEAANPEAADPEAGDADDGEDTGDSEEAADEDESERGDAPDPLALLPEPPTAAEFFPLAAPIDAAAQLSMF